MRLIDCLLAVLILSFSVPVSAQQIQVSEMASIEQVYNETQKSESVLSMNDLGIESGYVLYETEITFTSEEAVLEVENIRDYAAVYLDRNLKGNLTDECKKLALKSSVGTHKLQLYVENIGRITYGPDILDNSKGLFGSVMLNKAEVVNWNIIPLPIKECVVSKLEFTPFTTSETPAFYKATFQMEALKEIHVDISGWGMGELWMNGQYMGTYWAENSLKSIQIPASALVKGKNEVVIFDLKNSGNRKLELSDNAIFN